LPLERTPKGFEMMRERRVVGKVLVAP